MLIAAGQEPFRKMEGTGYDPNQAPSRAFSRNITTRGSDMIASRMKNRRDRLANTSKRLKISIYRGKNGIIKFS